MQLIDSHCHLDDECFDADRSEIIKRAASVGVRQCIVPAIHASSCRKIHALSMEHEEIRPAFGLHPWFCLQHRQQDLALIAELLDCAVAIGECGLDFARRDIDTQTQLNWLRPQLKLAAESGLPLILHSVKATDALIAEIKAVPGIRGVVHSFGGSLQQAMQLIDLGFYLGFGGAVCRSNAIKLHALIQQLPQERILLETDAPDQPAPEHRGKRNRPEFLVEIAAQIASLRGMDSAALASVCYANTRELYHL